jgi:hypothetical protein
MVMLLFGGTFFESFTFFACKHTLLPFRYFQFPPFNFFIVSGVFFQFEREKNLNFLPLKLRDCLS